MAATRTADATVLTILRPRRTRPAPAAGSIRCAMPGPVSRAEVAPPEAALALIRRLAIYEMQQGGTQNRRVVWTRSELVQAAKADTADFSIRRRPAPLAAPERPGSGEIRVGDWRLPSSLSPGLTAA